MTRRHDLDDVFDFTDHADLAAAALPGVAPSAREPRLATGTMPRLELDSGPEPPDSARATTRMSVEEVLELRAVGRAARQPPPTPLLDSAPHAQRPPPVPIARSALPHLLPVRPPARRRLVAWGRAAWRQLVARRWQLRDLAAALAMGVIIGLLAPW